MIYMESYLRPNVFIFNRQMDRAMKRGEKKKDLVEAWRILLGDASPLLPRSERSVTLDDAGIWRGTWIDRA